MGRSHDPLFDEGRRKHPFLGFLFLLLVLVMVTVAVLNTISNSRVSLLKQSVTVPNLPSSLENFRILPISDYRQLLAPYNWELTVLPGQYNEHRKGPKLWASYLINRIIRRGFIMSPRSLKGRRAYNKSLKLAPFIYLVVKAQTTDDKKK